VVNYGQVISNKVMGMVISVLLPIVAGAQVSWLNDNDIQRRLAAGEVVVHTVLDGDEPRGRVHAAVRINAAPEAIWRVMMDCERAPSFIPGLKGCRRIEAGPDGTWELVEHQVKYSWYMPTVRYVFRADYQKPRRIDFHRVSGDVKDERGTWLLEPTSDASATIVEYQVYIDPGFWIPAPLLRQCLRSELPAGLAALRTRVESTAMAAK
jgi:ribosome-associated toxin RatA of RatAB toxin-antitoxin module